MPEKTESEEEGAEDNDEDEEDEEEDEEDEEEDEEVLFFFELAGVGMGFGVGGIVERFKLLEIVLLIRCQRFLTALSVRPGRYSAILIQ